MLFRPKPLTIKDLHFFQTLNENWSQQDPQGGELAGLLSILVPPPKRFRFSPKGCQPMPLKPTEHRLKIITPQTR